MTEENAVDIYVCSDDATQHLGTASTVEIANDYYDGAKRVILRGVNFDTDKFMQAEVNVLRRDIEFYKCQLEKEIAAHKKTRDKAVSQVDVRYWANDLGVESRWLEEALLNLGMAIDYEPTESEKLEHLISGHINVGGVTPSSLAEYLVAHGVTAGDD